MLIYAASVVLNHDEVGSNMQRILKINYFINKYNQNGINYPTGKDDWKMFEKNNKKIALNLLFTKKGEMSCLNICQNTTQIMKNKSFF